MSVYTRKRSNGLGLPTNPKDEFIYHWEAGEALRPRRKRRKSSRPNSRIFDEQLLTRRLTFEECRSALLWGEDIEAGEMVGITINDVVYIVSQPPIDAAYLNGREAYSCIMVDKKTEEAYLVIYLPKSNVVQRFIKDGPDNWMRLHGSLTTLAKNGYGIWSAHWSADGEMTEF